MRRRIGSAITLVAACAIASCGTGGSAPPESATTYSVEIERTSYGIPHVKASDLKSLAYGAAYAYAQDNVCAFAAMIVRVNGESSKYFGETSTAAVGAAGMAALDADFVHKLQYDRATITALWQQASPETQQGAEGYAAGYNRYLRDQGSAKLPAECRGAAWVRPIEAADLYLYWSTLATGSGTQGNAQMIADAGLPQPLVALDAPSQPRAAPAALAASRLLAEAGHAMAQEDPALLGHGSNGWAFGKDVTANGKGLLLANPHWGWTGMLKYTQAHLTVPGTLDVMGTIRPGTPYVVMGFNRSMAWTHTISTGVRAAIRELELGATPTSYVVDGETRPMTARSIQVELRGGGFKTRTYYTTEFGPLVKSAALGLDWTASRAFAFTDPGLRNNRLNEQYLALGQAPTAEAARQALARVLALPSHNTLIADSSGDVVYADYSLKVHLDDAQLAACALPGVGQTQTARGRPVMDGSRSSCNPGSAPGARQDGILPPAKLPFLRRTDYVANANNSYWLANPAQPITGLPLVNGAPAAEMTQRARMNYTLIEERLAGRDGLAGTRLTAEHIQAMLIGSSAAPLAGNRGHAAQLLMPAVLSLCQGATTVLMPDGSAQDLTEACQVLSAWDRRYHIDSIGPHVFREFFLDAKAIGASLWAVPFSAADPIHTPREPNLADPAVVLKLRQALGSSVRKLAANGIALRQPWGELNYATARGQKLPTGGGSTDEGVANQITGPTLGANGYGPVTGGSSYVSTVGFDADGPVAEAILIPGQSTDPSSPYYYDQLEQLWTQRKWHRLPFTPSQIAADPGRTRLQLSE